MSLILPQRFAQPPQYAAPVDNNPFTKGLVFAFEAPHGQRNAATGALGEALGTGVAKGFGPFGAEYTCSGSQASRACSFGVDQGLSGATQATWDILVKFNSANPSTHFFGQWDFSLYWLMQASAGGLVWVAADDNSGNRSRFDVSAAFPTAGYYRIIASWRGSSGGNGDRSVLINGVEKTTSQSSAAATSIGTSNTLDYLQLGMVNGGTALNGSIVFARAWNRGMSLAEMRALHNAPSMVLKPPTRKLWAGLSSGNLAAAASGASTAGGAAALAAQVALGAVGVAVAGGSAALGASVPLSATGISVADGTAGATATVTLSAAGLAAAAGSAGLSASVLLAASGAAQASGNADLAAQLAALASGASQADGSAGLSVSVQLVATGASAASGTANLSGGAPGAINASGTAQADGSASATVTVALTAAGFVQAIGAGQLSISVDLTAAGASIAAGSARLVDLGAVVLTRAPAGGGSSIIAPHTARPLAPAASRPQQMSATRPASRGGRRY